MIDKALSSFTIGDSNREAYCQKILALPKGVLYQSRVTEKKSKRSNEQNKWMRGFAADFGLHFGYSPDEAYDLLMYKFCPEFVTDPEGNEIRMPGHFSKLQDGTPRDTKNAAEIQEQVLIWGANLGVMFMERAA